MKNLLSLAKRKPTILSMALLIIFLSIAWTSQLPSVKTYSTGITSTAKGTLITCASRSQFETPKQLLKQIYPEINIDLNKLKGIIFYHNLPKETSINATIDITAIEAISLYYIDQFNFLNHVAYLKQNTSFFKVSDLSLKANFITFNDIHFTQNYLSKMRILNSYHFFSNLTAKPHASTQNDFGMMRTFNEDLRFNGPNDCPPPCPPDEGSLCRDPDKVGGDPICTGGICGIKWAGDNNDVQATFSQEYRQNNLDLDLYTQFRYKFLAGSLLGKKYINYYYSLGDYLKTTSKFNSEIMIKAVKLAPCTYKIANLLLSDKGMEAIVITENEKNDFVQLLQVLKGLSDGKDYQAIIADIEKDMHSFAGKSKSQLLDYINSQK